MGKAYCEHCGKELKPAIEFSDGEPTYVGYIPCACDKPIQTDYGTVYPGEEEHTALLESGRYSINDLLAPVKVMKKLTLVSLACRSKVVTAFINLPILENGKVILPMKIIDKLFWDIWKFVPTRGETISFI